MFKRLKELFASKPVVSKFVCSSCGKEHDEWPAISYSAPESYFGLSDADKNEIAELSSDFCTISYSDGQIDRFIRAVLFLNVDDNCQQLDYGLWVSLSKESYMDYFENFKNDNHEAIYFGWICSSLEGYRDTFNIPADVILSPNGKRPQVRPHHDHDHLLVYDYYNGISKAEAEKRISVIVQNSGN